MKQYFLFDLDGTLTDPKIGITTSVQYALAAMGIVEEDIDKLEPFIGPPLKDSFMEFYGFTEKQAEDGIEKYRERFADIGLYENKLYEGIPELLRTLRSKGMGLAVASSKPTVFVEKILKYFKILDYFDVVVGSELDGSRVEKSEVIEEALKQIFVNRPIEFDKIYMIGDRKFDIEGGKSFGIETIGVSYGYGGIEELKKAKADYIVRNVEELEKLLLREVNASTGKPKGFFQTMWPLLYPFLLFMLIKQVAERGLVLLVGFFGENLQEGWANFLLIKDEAGSLIGLTGNAATIMSAITFAVAGGFIWKIAKPMIEKAKEDAVLGHLKGEAPKSYLYLACATVGAVLGINILFELMQVTTKSLAYQEVLNDQYSASIIVGLLSFGIVTPIAEEILFRGIIFNQLKKGYPLLLAIIISAVGFGAYHMNYVQGIYAFVLGAFMAYAYEYFGDFKIPVLIHMSANILAYIITYTSIVKTVMYSWPIGSLFLCIGILGVYCLNKKKKIL